MSVNLSNQKRVNSIYDTVWKMKNAGETQG